MLNAQQLASWLLDESFGLSQSRPFSVRIPQSLKDQLRADAAQFGRHYGVFFSTSGKAYIEPISPNAQYQYIWRTDRAEETPTITEARRGPEIKTLKKNRRTLEPEERDQVMKAKAVWHPGNHDKPVPAVWKSVVDGKTWFCTNTHRCGAVRTTLKGAIHAFHHGVKQSA